MQEDALIIGVLGLQGTIREHVQALEKIGVRAIVVKNKEQLSSIDGLILPSGESSTMHRLLERDGWIKPLQQFGRSGKPMFGTSAGLVLLARTIVGQKDAHLGLMDIQIEQNILGRQRESFETELSVARIGDVKAIFIRSPYMPAVGENVEVLAKYEGRIVAVREENYLGCSFLPELTNDDQMYKYFLKMVNEQSCK